MLTLFACKDARKSEHNTDKPALESVINKKKQFVDLRFNYRKVDEHFKHQDISKIDSANAFDFQNPDKSIMLSEEQYYSALQDSNIEFYDSEINTAYCYSKQKDFKAYKRYIFACTTEMISNHYLYAIYDKNGRKTSSFVFYGIGGDGGWHYNLHSKQINDSTFIQTNIDCESTVDSLNNLYSSCDSSITQYTILDNGALKEVSLGKFTVIKK